MKDALCEDQLFFVFDTGDGGGGGGGGGGNGGEPVELMPGGSNVEVRGPHVIAGEPYKWNGGDWGCSGHGLTRDCRIPP